MYEDFDEEEKVAPQEALDNFYYHCMEYVSLYDYDENDVGDYEVMDDDTRDMWKQPLQELVNRDEPKEVKNNRCPNCEWIVDTKDKFCPHCGQRLEKILVESEEKYMSKNDKQRDYLANGSISMFCAEVAKLTNSHCLLKNIAISGIRADGTGYEGKEDHVNIIDSEDISALKSCNIHVGDKIYFGADVYEYKRKDGSEDFGVKNLREIEKIDEYDLPTREELIDGQIWELVCEVCTFREKCDKMCCLANSEEMQKRFQILKDLQPGKFTAFTVVAAYEIWGKVITQMGGFKCPTDDPNYELIKKIERLSSENDSGIYWNLDEALARIFYPEYRRIYFN